MGPPEGTVPKGAKFLGVLSIDPTTSELIDSDEPGWWWFNSTSGVFKFWDGTYVSIVGGTFNKSRSIPVESLGLPNTNPPTIVDQDNLTLYKFTVNTDKTTLKLEVPVDYTTGTDLTFLVVWTNDGGVDDNNKNVKWQLDYQVGTEGDVISGSHANSPKTVEDTYNSASGWVEHHTAVMTIAAADFLDKQCVFLKLSTVTAPATVLSCEPHLIGICFGYTARRSLL